MQVLTDPDRFFETDPRAGSLRWSASVVTFSALLGIISSIVIMKQMVVGLSASGRAFVAIGYAIGTVASFLSSYFIWFLYAGIFYSISIYFDGKGDFKSVFVHIGWGFIPEIISSLLSVGAILIVAGKVGHPSSVDALNTFVQTIQTDPVMRVVKLVGLALAIWQAQIWIFAVKHARSLSIRHAIATVGIPMAVSIGWEFINLLGLV